MPDALRWSTESLSSRARRHRLMRGDESVSWEELVARLSDDAAARASLTECLAASEYPAIYWETPPVSAATRQRPFEMVVLPSERLARIDADAHAFDEHLHDATTPIITFPNLRGDARLVVPQDLGGPEAYGHLAAFVRHAPAEQIDALWQTLGRAVEAWWSTQDAPVWVSTAGDGVPWLHVRLDRRPKYYKHREYCTPPS